MTKSTAILTFIVNCFFTVLLTIYQNKTKTKSITPCHTKKIQNKKTIQLKQKLVNTQISFLRARPKHSWRLPWPPRPGVPWRWHSLPSEAPTACFRWRLPWFRSRCRPRCRILPRFSCSCGAGSWKREKSL